MSADPAQALRAVQAGGDEVERRYAADAWQAGELGVPAARGRRAVSFTGIGQSWLREGAKRWARQRLSIGCAFNTICAGAIAFKRFSRFLAAGEPPATRPQDIDRALLERYLGYLAPLPLADSTKVLSRVFLRGFLEENRRYRWVPTIPAGATIYPEELSGRRRTPPRFIPEFVMGQLESEENLARLRPPYRNLIVLIAQTGLRAGDACALPFDPLLSDSAGWPCLRFASSKMRAEHQLPLSAQAIEAIRAQQDHVRQRYPDGSAWLFPSRSDLQQPIPYDTLRLAFARWQQRISLHDETGGATKVTIHQFRHTFGTRMKVGGIASGTSFGMVKDRWCA
ncbi:MAG TPA: tyrosine-type recombinase/integrase [Nakamurella sp.]|nr:tyrosine-type recombinase/integrase [Nakamurella sp.]